MPEYAGRVRGVSKNILPVRGSIHSYYTPSQARSQNAPPSAVISEMITEALIVRDEQHKKEMEEHLAQQREQLKGRDEQHKREMEERLAQQREQMEVRFTQQREEHMLDMDTITRRFAAQLAGYDARF
ncbi:hypothetical protein FH972_015315 [Carpinus fangiana]|uniref:Uncharacterized protein n=1 Tax=Carpinus fangiana TaxID=176857 RepID=A0A5N6RFY8_9ROSI|nr:hypothetical protein FH972_015315 [Carpinus fangiana]